MIKELSKNVHVLKMCESNLEDLRDGGYRQHVFLGFILDLNRLICLGVSTCQIDLNSQCVQKLVPAGPSTTILSVEVVRSVKVVRRIIHTATGDC